MTDTRWALLLGLALLAGCATATQKRGDRAFERGDYLAAVDYYDAAVREKPDSARLQAKRWSARAGAVDELALHTEARRRAGDRRGALASARAAAEARARWFAGADASRLPRDAHARVDQLSDWAIALVSADVQSALAAQKPLLARKALVDARGLFEAAGLGARARELASRIDGDGRTRCAELRSQGVERSAHLAYWVAAYCRAFGDTPPPVPADAEQIGALRIQSDTLGPTSAEERARLEARLEQLLIASPWFHEAAPALASATLSGTHTAAYSKEKRERVAHWMERVPYQVQESYQQPYTDTEHYTAQESYTDYRTESYSCGYGTTSRTCTRSVPNTRYRSVQKSRQVTKYRTQYRTVTRYRDEPRVFHYQAMEHRGDYAANWQIALALPGALPFAVTVGGQTHETSDEHDVSFAPAGIQPSRPRLMTHEQWFDDRVKALTAELPGRLRAHWIANYCTAEHWDDAQAARCARGAADETPAPAKAALDAFLRDDVASLLGAR